MNRQNWEKIMFGTMLYLLIGMPILPADTPTVFSWSRSGVIPLKDATDDAESTKGWPHWGAHASSSDQIKESLCKPTNTFEEQPTGVVLTSQVRESSPFYIAALADDKISVTVKDLSTGKEVAGAGGTFGDGSAYYTQNLAVAGTPLEANKDYEVTVTYINTVWMGKSGLKDGDGFSIYKILLFDRYLWEAVGTKGTEITAGKIQSKGGLFGTDKDADGLAIKPGDVLSLALASLWDYDDYIVYKSGVATDVVKVEDKGFTYLWDCDKEKGIFSRNDVAAPSFTATTNPDHGGKCKITLTINNSADSTTRLDPPGADTIRLMPGSTRKDAAVTRTATVNTQFPMNVWRVSTLSDTTSGGYWYITTYRVVDGGKVGLDGVTIDEAPKAVGSDFIGRTHKGSGTTKDGGIFTDTIGLLTGEVQLIDVAHIQNPITAKYGKYTCSPFRTITYDMYKSVQTYVNGLPVLHNPPVVYTDGIKDK
jgi:hypothetical protein